MEPIQDDIQLKELILDLRGKAVGYEYNDEEMLAWGDEALVLLDRLVAERDRLIADKTFLNAHRLELLAGVGALVEKWTDRANGMDRGLGWETAKCADELEALTKTTEAVESVMKDLVAERDRLREELGIECGGVLRRAEALEAERDRLILERDGWKEGAFVCSDELTRLTEGIGALVEKYDSDRHYGTMWAEVRNDLRALTTEEQVDDNA